MITGLPRPSEVLRSPAPGDAAADDGGVGWGPPRGSARALLAAELGRSSRPSGPCRRQLVQVVRGGDEAPLTGERFTTDIFTLTPAQQLLYGDSIQKLLSAFCHKRSYR